MASDEQIRELAYRIWKEEGSPEGKASEHYFRAKRILERQEAMATQLKDQFLLKGTLPSVLISGDPGPRKRRSRENRPVRIK